MKRRHSRLGEFQFNTNFHYWRNSVNDFAMAGCPKGNAVPNPLPPPRKKKKKSAKKNLSDPLASKLKLNSSLGTFEEQALDIIAQCAMSKNRLQQVGKVLDDLYNNWTPLISDFRPKVFGSVATGLAFHTSDIDCYVDSQVIPDPVERNDFLMNNYKVMFRGRRFSNVVRIGRARVPLIKAVHRDTGFEIDLTCLSSGALYNTELIKYLVECDSRVRQLILLVSLFYRRKGIIGTNRLISYAFTLLVIFYLQNLKEPLLPPICKLLKRTEDCVWPRELKRDLSKFVKSSSIPLAELFAGFFRFYASFDFSENVVSPYLGQVIPTSSFTELEQLPEELVQLRTHLMNSEVNEFVGKIMCVQDPIELHLNKSLSLRKNTMDAIIRLNSTFSSILTTTPQVEWLAKLMAEESPALISKLNNVKTAEPDFFTVRYPLNDPNNLNDLRDDLTSVFELLLLSRVELIPEPEPNTPSSDVQVDSHPILSFQLKANFNVFSEHFKSLFLNVIDHPETFSQVKSQLLLLSFQTEGPTETLNFKMTLRNPAKDKLQVGLTNTDVRNSFVNVQSMLNKHFESLLMAAYCYRTNRNPNSAVKELTAASTTHKVDFILSINPKDTVDDWKDFKRYLTSTFDLLLFTCREFNESSAIVSYEIETHFNVFTKRFKSLYLEYLKCDTCPTTIRRKIRQISENMKEPTSSFLARFIVRQCDSSSVHVELVDVNTNVQNTFDFIKAMLRTHFPALFSAARRECATLAPVDNVDISQIDCSVNK